MKNFLDRGTTNNSVTKNDEKNSSAPNGNIINIAEIPPVAHDSDGDVIMKEALPEDSAENPPAEQQPLESVTRTHGLGRS